MASIFKRELKAYFITPLGYVFLAVFLMFSGLFFFWLSLAPKIADMTGVFSSSAIILMCVVPLLTMRLMAEDNRQKTDQLLLTSPVSLTEIVAGKFFAAFTVILAGCLIFIADGLVLSAFSEVYWRTVFGNIAGLLALSAVFTAIGIFISCLTENQMIAAILGLFVNFVFYIGSLVFDMLPPEIGSVLKKFSLFDRYDELTRGVFKPGTIIFFLSVAFIFLFLTARALESRRWK